MELARALVFQKQKLISYQKVRKTVRCIARVFHIRNLGLSKIRIVFHHVRMNYVELFLAQWNRPSLLAFLILIYFSNRKLTVDSCVYIACMSQISWIGRSRRSLRDFWQRRLYLLTTWPDVTFRPLGFFRFRKHCIQSTCARDGPYVLVRTK